MYNYKRIGLLMKRRVVIEIPIELFNLMAQSVKDQDITIKKYIEILIVQRLMYEGYIQ